VKDLRHMDDDIADMIENRRFVAIFVSSGSRIRPVWIYGDWLKLASPARKSMSTYRMIWRDESGSYGTNDIAREGLSSAMFFS